jgi:hypothetical protein
MFKTPVNVRFEHLSFEVFQKLFDLIAAFS